MAELDLSVTLRFGSGFTFSPPGGAVVKGSVTVHRQHGARVEGTGSLLLGRRLARVYGWGMATLVERERLRDSSVDIADCEGRYMLSDTTTIRKGC